MGLALLFSYSLFSLSFRALNFSFSESSSYAYVFPMDRVSFIGSACRVFACFFTFPFFGELSVTLLSRDISNDVSVASAFLF